MKAIQYTVRNIPAPVDRYLRKRAKISGQSLNTVILQELGNKAEANKGAILESLDWFIGSGVMDDDVQRILDEDDKIQKELVRKEWQDDDNRY